MGQRLLYFELRPGTALGSEPESDESSAFIATDLPPTVVPLARKVGVGKPAASATAGETFPCSLALAAPCARLLLDHAVGISSITSAIQPGSS